MTAPLVTPRLALLGLVLLVACAPTCSARASPAAAPAAIQPTGALDRTARWREDLAHLAKELPARHLDFFRKHDRADFERAVAALDAAIPTLADHEVALGLCRIASMANDAHTTVDWSTLQPRFRHYPVALAWFTDGLFVFVASEEHKDLVGARVARISDLDAESAAAAVRPFFAAENESSFRSTSAQRLTVAEFLHAAGIIDSAAGAATFTFVDASGNEFVRALAPFDPATAPPKWVRPWDADPSKQPFRATPGPAKPYWLAPTPDGRAIYIQYNRCQSDPTNPFPEFTAQAMKAIDEAKPERVIVDLRFNGGGDSRVMRPLLDGLKQNETVNAHGRLFVLIGRGTFSSAQLNAADFRRETKAVIIGEPTGQKPNAFGEIRPFKLPHSGLSVYYSTKYFQTDPADPESFMPDVEVRASSAEYFSGGDPILEAALMWSEGDKAPH